MLDAFLKTKFYCRCKSEIKQTMKRIEMIRRKRNAMQKFMRNDVADLLKTGLDSNAIDRVGQLYADQNLSWCYEFVEQSCLLILSQLSTINKQRECPEDCKGAIATLMFAAARFADLPELRDLRSLFAERYGNYLEPYANQEFVKNLKADPPTEQVKLQMLHDIALEYNINWNLKALEQKLYKPPPFVQNSSRYTNGRNNESLKIHHQNGLETNVKSSLPYKSRDQLEKDRNPVIRNSETKKEEKRDHGRLSPCWSSNTSSSGEGATSADDSADEFRPMASPYIKTESTKKSTFSETIISGRKDGNIKSGIPQGKLRSMGPPYIKPDLSKKTGGSNVNVEDVSKPVPTSMRNRRPLKQAAGSTRGDNDGLKAIPKNSNGENSFLDHDNRDDEEKKMDKLLSHYSRKPSHLPAPKRIISLPSEPVAAGGAVDERKGLSRAATYQPGAGLGAPGHVHPKLPDYDDFVAQLAAFRAS